MIDAKCGKKRNSHQHLTLHLYVRLELVECGKFLESRENGGLNSRIVHCQFDWLGQPVHVLRFRIHHGPRVGTPLLFQKPRLPPLRVAFQTIYVRIDRYVVGSPQLHTGMQQISRQGRFQDKHDSRVSHSSCDRVNDALVLLAI